MKNKILKYTAKTIFSGMIPSVIAATVLTFYPVSWNGIVIADSMVNAVFLFLLMHHIMRFRMKAKGIKRYYKIVLPALSVYCLLAGGFALFLHFWRGKGNFELFSNIYAFLFLNFKMARFATALGDVQIGLTQSAFCSAAVYFLIAAILPLFVNKKSKEKMLGYNSKNE